MNLIKRLCGYIGIMSRFRKVKIKVGHGGTGHEKQRVARDERGQDHVSRSICFSGHALQLITVICPIFLVNFISN